MGTKKWYVLRTAGGKEKKAKLYLEKEIEKSGLQDLVSQVLVPVEKKFTVKNGKRVSTERLLYPSYVLIEAELSPDLQYIIRNLVPGMSGFLTDKNKADQSPVPLRDDEVRRILGQYDDAIDSPANVEVDYNTGDAVKIIDGPFSGFEGVVDEIVEDRSKLKVVVMIFGRKSLLELSFNQVTKE